jgi:hypothetical protein
VGGAAWTNAADDNTGAINFWLSHGMISIATYSGILDNCNMSTIGPLLMPQRAMFDDVPQWCAPRHHHPCTHRRPPWCICVPVVVSVTVVLCLVLNLVIIVRPSPPFSPSLCLRCWCSSLVLIEWGLNAHTGGRRMRATTSRTLRRTSSVTSTSTTSTSMCARRSRRCVYICAHVRVLCHVHNLVVAA